MGNMKFFVPYKKRIKLLIISLIVIFAFFVGLNEKMYFGVNIRESAKTTQYTEKDWLLEDENKTIKETIQLPNYRTLEKGKIYTITKKITYDGSKDRLPYGFIHLDHLFVRISIDDEVLFSYMPEDVEGRYLSKSSGFIYKAFEMPYDCKGKTLKIEVKSLLTESLKCALPDIKFGDLTSTIDFYFRRDILPNIFIFLFVLLGLAAIAFSTFHLNSSEYKEGFNIGIFSLLFAMYLITECEFDTYFIGNPYYIYILNYVVFSLLPIAMIAFMRERLPENRRKLLHAVVVVEEVLFAIEMLLHISRLVDLREMITFVHVVYFFNISLVIILITLIKNKKKKHGLILQLLPIFIGMVIDGIIYWFHIGVILNDATFSIFGVTVFMIIELYRVWKYSIKIYMDSFRTEMYKEMAFIDKLTGIQNRRAYENKIDEIQSSKKKYTSLYVVSLDLNDLKYVNDNYGHEAGDMLIKNAARFMKEGVKHYGDVFRVGGDEFMIFMYNINSSKYDEFKKFVFKKANEFSKNNKFKMSIAIGHAKAVDKEDILTTIKESDKRMYYNKTIYKESLK